MGKRWSKCHGEPRGPHVSQHLVGICILGHPSEHILSSRSVATGLPSQVPITSKEMLWSVA